MQAARANTVREGVLPDSRRAELLQMDVTVLEFRQARNLSVSRPANQFKRANCSLQR